MKESCHTIPFLTNKMFVIINILDINKFIFEIAKLGFVN